MSLVLVEARAGPGLSTNERNRSERAAARVRRYEFCSGTSWKDAETIRLETARARNKYQVLVSVHRAGEAIEANEVEVQQSQLPYFHLGLSPSPGPSAR